MAPSAQTEDGVFISNFQHPSFISPVQLTWRLFQPRNNISSLEKYKYLDVGTFEQILEMDDEDQEREFSRSIVYGFFDQAEATFLKMESAM
ncbi:uncharacterized protein ARB_03929 [Trichophyton benhamiae CBS 112371]|uniref:Uncharacterized protein n=1 Tax=Arthroderma benhamiae (strain ATCC MYA-4681 / CBS 112371) TaxID=663331 RepID=D4B622_ARTBC|nr:uncharacterized protein ARB_03929 [Trichophyton benhamiae CBS 112371]EFE29217.1 hypothetical protein ARB_03929 [Trichophyton benhamiae CBS 112371]